MKLKEFKFNDIPVRGLSIFVDGKEVVNGFIGEVLREIPHLADHKIVDTNIYFDEFVIRLKEDCSLVKSGDRVEALEEKRTWNGEKILVKKGQKGTAFDDGELSSEIRVTFDGHYKNTWYKVRNLKLI